MWTGLICGLHVVPVYQTWAYDANVLEVAAGVLSWVLAEALQYVGLSSCTVNLFEEDWPIRTAVGTSRSSDGICGMHMYVRTYVRIICVY